MDCIADDPALCLLFFYIVHPHDLLRCALSFGGDNEAARFHQGHSRFGGVSACCTRTTTGAAGDWLSQLYTSPDERPTLLAAFRQGLEQAGFVSGRNVAIEFRSANGSYER